ncbi:hypothetical protein SAMN05421780_11343 [Flexibacter flexilis DSM 6793]|uniref:DNA alkylation repair enzyme n=1 Tax=Flexibacter flexilis DSM 6793 TaxID=927664 RepID=A0A1I1N8B9_9BACT|nr:hypothetical protein [Flexibacter flexilis]SFC93964.1 hypothetical protein SAMN05421780_11343 [Flexibacter flexilis DSM 6793]
METDTLNYLAEKILNDVRNKSSFSNSMLDDMNSFPLVDYLREQVIDSDVEVIISLIKSEDINLCYLGLNLVNRVLHLELIKKYLITFWNNTDDYERRYFLMWPLLNNSQLTEKMHKEIFEFVTDNWEKWKLDYTKFAGGSANLVSFSEKRFYDKKFPNSKKWIYILGLKAIGNKTDIHVALSKFKLDNSNEMQQKVLSILKSS